MKKIFTTLLLAAVAVVAMADVITLTGNSVRRSHDLNEGSYIVEYTSVDEYDVKVTYFSETEAGTFTEALDIWNSLVQCPNGELYYADSCNITVVIDADLAYHMTGILHTSFSENPEILQDFQLDLHRAAPIPARDTVNFVSNNATWSHNYDGWNWTDVASFEATENGRTLHVAYNGWAAYTGELEAGLIENTTIVSHDGQTYPMDRFVSGQVELESDKTFNLTAEIVFEDSSLYNITMKAPIPTMQQTDTLEMYNLTAEVNPMSGDLMLRAGNDIIEITIYQQNGYITDTHIEGQGVSAEITDLSTYDTYMAYYVSADLSLLLTDSQTVVADIYGSNNVLYHVTMIHVIPAAQDTIDITIANAQFTNLKNQYEYQLMGQGAEYETQVSLMLAGGLEQGDNYTDLDFDYIVRNNSFVSPINGMPVYFLTGTCGYSRDENDLVTFHADVLGEDAYFYRITLSGQWEPMHLDEDAQTGDINQTFSSSDNVEIDIESVQNYNPASFEVTDLAQTRSMVLSFVVYPDSIDWNNPRIPAAVYPIEDTYYEYTVRASRGLEYNYETWQKEVTPSLYVEQDAADATLFHYYFFQTGTVTVSYSESGAMTIAVDAYNSYNRHVQVTYTGAATGIRQQIEKAAVTKRLENGRIVIRSGNTDYSIDGRVIR